jgi:hypothetical protein
MDTGKEVECEETEEEVQWQVIRGLRGGISNGGSVGRRREDEERIHSTLHYGGGGLDRFKIALKPQVPRDYVGRECECL